MHKFFSRSFLRSLDTPPTCIDVRDTEAAAELYDSITATYGSYSRDMLMSRWVDQGRGIVPRSFTATCPGLAHLYGDEKELGGSY